MEDGYQVFLMEYRGFGNSEGEASHDAAVRDAHRAFRYLVSRDDVKDRPVLVLGQSYGAQLAIHIATAYPEEIAVLAIEGAFSSFRDIAIYSSPWIAKPFTWAFFLNPYDSTELIKHVSMPKLIIHSMDDEVVPFSMSQELFDLASGEKELWKIRGRHTDALVDYPAETVSRINRMAGFAPN